MKIIPRTLKCIGDEKLTKDNLFSTFFLAYLVSNALLVSGIYVLFLIVR